MNQLLDLAMMLTAASQSATPYTPFQPRRRLAPEPGRFYALVYSTSLNTAKLVGVVPNIGKLKPHCGHGSDNTACSFLRS
jgi:hypothetical protein